MESMFQTAVILAGGRSRRMGFDKQLLEIDETHKYLAVYLAEQLLESFREVIVVTNTPQLYEGVPVRTCRDIYPGEGPVSGIHSAFCHCDSEYLFVMACDMMEFSPAYSRYQAQRMEREQSEACVTLHGDRMEPFHGFYRRSLLEDMEQKLIAHKTSVFGLLKKHRITEITEEEARAYADPEKLFRNLNTPQDYEKVNKREMRE